MQRFSIADRRGSGLSRSGGRGDAADCEAPRPLEWPALRARIIAADELRRALRMACVAEVPGFAAQPGNFAPEAVLRHG